MKYLGIDAQIYDVSEDTRYHPEDYGVLPEPVLRMQKLLEAMERHFVTWPIKFVDGKAVFTDTQ